MPRRHGNRKDEAARDAHQAHIMKERQAKVAQFYLEGKSQHLIAELVGVSQGTIYNDLGSIRKEWLESSVRNFDEAKEVELRKLGNLEKEAYEAWMRSKEEAVSRKKKLEKGRVMVPVAGTRGRARSHRPRMVITRQNDETTETERDGDPRFLAMIFQCIQLRLKILGALEQDKTLNVNVTKLDWDSMYKRQEELLRIDPVSERLLREQGMPVQPSTTPGGVGGIILEQFSTSIQLPPELEPPRPFTTGGKPRRPAADLTLPDDEEGETPEEGGRDESGNGTPPDGTN